MSTIETNLKYYSAEISIASETFYMWKSMQDYASQNAYVLQALNSNALSWTTVDRSLICTFFITLGRIFDASGDAFSIHKLLKSCIKNIDEFSRENLSARISARLKPPQLDAFITDTYEPTKHDFRELKKEVSIWKNVYEKIYMPIRHMIFAHKNVSFIVKSNELFGQTSKQQVHDMMIFLHFVHTFIFHLYHNGIKLKRDDFKFTEDQEMITDVNSLLEVLTKGLELG